MKAANEDKARQETKKNNYKQKPVAQQLLHSALANQQARFTAAVKKRKQKYDKDVKFEVTAIRNDAAMWKAKYKKAEKQSKMSAADKKELEHWKMFGMWIEAHARPKTAMWLWKLWTHGPPKAAPQYS